MTFVQGYWSYTIKTTGWYMLSLADGCTITSPTGRTMILNSLNNPDTYILPLTKGTTLFFHGGGDHDLYFFPTRE